MTVKHDETYCSVCKQKLEYKESKDEYGFIYQTYYCNKHEYIHTKMFGIKSLKDYNPLAFSERLGLVALLNKNSGVIRNMKKVI